jgi:mono/diheme cytochrome c family protein
VSGFSRTVAAQAPVDGAAVYAASCASCHDQPTGRTPPKDALKERTADAIHLSLTSGSMAIQGLTLSVAEKKAVSEYLSGKPLGAASAQDTWPLRRKAGGARQPGGETSVERVGCRYRQFEVSAKARHDGR